MESSSTGHPRRNSCAGSGLLSERAAALGGLLLFLLALPLSAHASLPDSPPRAAKPGPCQLRRAGGALTATAAEAAVAASGAVFSPRRGVEAVSCLSLEPLIDWYARFLNGPEVKPFSPREKARLAARNLLDPFNAMTILGSSAIAVGSNANSPYGPGMHGFGRYVGVSYAQDLTGEFFGTFLIPSLVHQDPHYHRLPDASIKRRIAHAAYQVLWTQSDNGHEMPNYANLFGYAIGDEIGNLYVPGRQTNLPASAARYGAGLAAAPIDNFITEFLPDVARHIHVRVVLIQRIINQVARTGGPGSP